MFARGKTHIPTWLILAFLLVSLIGFVDAGYLTAKHFQHEAPTCSIVEGCDVVTSSAYSTIGPVPVALLGALYYLAIFILSLIYFDTRAYWVKQLLPYVTVFGLVASIYFVIVQIFMLKAICLYCMGSAITSITLFILALTLLRYKK